MEEDTHEGVIERVKRAVGLDGNDRDTQSGEKSWVDTEAESLTLTTDEPVDPLMGSDPAV
jgi:hypothetical protein